MSGWEFCIFYNFNIYNSNNLATFLQRNCSARFYRPSPFPTMIEVKDAIVQLPTLPATGFSLSPSTSLLFFLFARKTLLTAAPRPTALSLLSAAQMGSPTKLLR